MTLEDVSDIVAVSKSYSFAKCNDYRAKGIDRAVEVTLRCIAMYEKSKGKDDKCSIGLRELGEELKLSTRKASTDDKLKALNIFREKKNSLMRRLAYEKM